MQRDVAIASTFFGVSFLIEAVLMVISILFGPEVRDWWTHRNGEAVARRIVALQESLNPVNFEEQLFRMLGHLSAALWLFLVNLGVDLVAIVSGIIQPRGLAENTALAILLGLDLNLWGAYLLWVGFKFWEFYQREPTSPAHERYVATIHRRLRRLGSEPISGV